MSLLDVLNVFPAGIMIMEGAGRDAVEFQQLSELSHGFAAFVMSNHAWATIEDFLDQGSDDSWSLSVPDDVTLASARD